MVECKVGYGYDGRAGGKGVKGEDENEEEPVVDRLEQEGQ